jgi:hypothetical protein
MAKHQVAEGRGWIAVVSFHHNDRERVILIEPGPIVKRITAIKQSFRMTQLQCPVQKKKSTGKPAGRVLIVYSIEVGKYSYLT